MNKLKFAHDHGSAFYKELTAALDEYFKGRQIRKQGNRIMYFKIALYFGCDILFYALMITSKSVPLFYASYL
ncbi:MAG TPA: hypothetical protein VKH37_08140, partial [Ferruginibacter sp.]|nr:hypothetical protein [Ferruginibacter sp.]